MKESGISRRDFVKGLATGTLSFAFMPSISAEEELKTLGTAPIAGNKQVKKSLPTFFDCNKYLGPGFPQIPNFHKVKDLLAHMDRLGIDRALAWHTTARDLNPMPGNEELLKEISAANATNRIIPSFIIAPSIINEPEIMKHFLYLVKKNHVRAFHFFPNKFGWSLQDITPVIRGLLPYKPSLFLNCFESLGKDTTDILTFSGEFPKVSIIFTNAMWPHYEKLYELMKARSNIFVDISLLHTYRTIEYITHQFGVERLIFGTGYKSNNGASIALLAHSEISPKQAQLIAHGNLEHLLGIKSPLRGFKPVVGNRLWHRLLRQEKLGPEIIDSHTHFCSTRMKWNDHNPCDFDSHVNHSLRYMNSMGVRTMIIAEYILDIPGSPEGKTYMEEHLDKYGERFRGYFCALAFKSENAEKMIPILDKIFSRSYYVGFKMHNDHWNIPVTDPCFIPMWEYADSHRLPILLHTWNTKYNAPKMLNEIAPRYPNAIIILGHSGNTDRPDGVKLAEQNPNVYLEWCGSFVNPENWYETLDRIGNHRLLFGSDGVSWETQWGHSPVWEIGRLLSLDVPDEILLPILGDNMRNILSQRQ